MAIKSKKKKLEKELLTRRKAALQAEIGRRKLLQAIVARGREGKPVNVLARVEDKIPNVLVKRRDEEIKPTFIGKGRMI